MTPGDPPRPDLHMEVLYLKSNPDASKTERIAHPKKPTTGKSTTEINYAPLLVRCHEPQ